MTVAPVDVAVPGSDVDSDVEPVSSSRRKGTERAEGSSSIEGRESTTVDGEDAHITGFFGGKVVGTYEKVMRSVIQRPLVLTGAVIVIVILSAVSYHFLGSDLLPGMDEGGFILDYHTPPGSSLSESRSDFFCTSKKCSKPRPEVETTSRRTGLELGLAAVTESQSRRLHREAQIETQSLRNG